MSTAISMCLLKETPSSLGSREAKNVTSTFVLIKGCGAHSWLF